MQMCVVTKTRTKKDMQYEDEDENEAHRIYIRKSDHRIQPRKKKKKSSVFPCNPYYAYIVEEGIAASS
jgi:hypothetical protein